MPGALRPIPVRTPGVFGVASDIEGSANDFSIALTLKNAVINSNGRIAARNGWTLLTSTGNHGEDTNALYEFVVDNTETHIVSAADTAIYTGTSSLVDRSNPVGGLTPATADDWQFVTMSGKCYGFQASHTPIVWDPSGATYDANDFQDLSPALGTAPNGNSAVATHGRIFAFDSDMQTIKWCPLLNDDDWSGVGYGTINLENVWPNGVDIGVSLVVWNDYLVVFGERSVLVYSGLDDPGTNLALAGVTKSSAGINDTITDDGIVSRDAVISTGTDLIYLSRTGLRSLGRGLVHDKLPLTTVAPQIKLALSIDIETALSSSLPIRMEYHRQISSVVARIGTKYWYFDIRAMPTVIASRWEGIGWKCARSIGSSLYLGQNDGVAEYSGFQDGGSGYNWEWSSAWVPVGGERNIIPKQALMYLGADISQLVNLRWSWDYTGTLSTESRQVPVSASSLWGTGEFGIAEWGTGGTLLVQPYDMSGEGSLLQLAVSTVINGGGFSLQQINVLAKDGRLNR